MMHPITTFDVAVNPSGLLQTNFKRVNQYRLSFTPVKICEKASDPVHCHGTVWESLLVCHMFLES